MGNKSKTIKCSCGSDEFFVDTLGVEHCSKCFISTTFLHPEATHGLSYEQIKQAKELEKERQAGGANIIVEQEKLNELGLCGKCLYGYKAKIWVKPPFTEFTVTGHGNYTWLLKCKQGFNINGNTDKEIIEECECYKEK